MTNGQMWITMVSLTGRENQTNETIARLNSHGGLAEYDFTLNYFAPEGKHKRLDVADNCFVRMFTAVGQIEDWWHMVSLVPDGADWLFLEDDIWPCRNAVPRMVDIAIPEGVGLLSFFDMRNQWTKPGIWLNPPQYLWGSQAIKFPAHVVREFKRFADKKERFMAGWDTWMGEAVKALGLRVAHYSPSLVQHVGMVSLAYTQTGPGRPTAANFPGEDFDALGPCPEFIVQGVTSGREWEPRDHPDYCNLHKRIHPGGNYCPQIRRG